MNPSARTTQLLKRLDSLIEDRNQNPWAVGQLALEAVENHDLTVRQLEERYDKLGKSYLHECIIVSRQFPDKVQGANWWTHAKTLRIVRAIQKQAVKRGMPITPIDPTAAVKLVNGKANPKAIITETFAPELVEPPTMHLLFQRQGKSCAIMVSDVALAGWVKIGKAPKTLKAGSYQLRPTPPPTKAEKEKLWLKAMKDGKNLVDWAETDDSVRDSGCIP